MCYEYPGPKCGKHVQEKINQLKGSISLLERQNKNNKSKLDTLEYSEFDSRVLNNTTKDNMIRNIVARISRIEEEISDAQYKLETSQKEYLFTLEGIEDLSDEIVVNEELGYDTSLLESQLEERKNWYNRQIFLYDKKNKTVNCKPPAKDYSITGEMAVEDKIKESKKVIDALYAHMIASETPSQNKSFIDAVKAEEKEIEELREELAHIRLTAERVKQGIIPDTVQAKQYRDEMKKIYQRNKSTYDNSDVDGAATSLANNITLLKLGMQAELAEKCWKEEFVVLFDLNGKYVPAWPSHGDYGPFWSLIEIVDGKAQKTGKFVGQSSSTKTKTKMAYYAKKGYTLGRILAPAYVVIPSNGGYNPRPIYVQNHVLSNEDTIEVLDYNIYLTQLRKEEEENAS